MPKAAFNKSSGVFATWDIDSASARYTVIKEAPYVASWRLSWSPVKDHVFVQYEEMTDAEAEVQLEEDLYIPPPAEPNPNPDADVPVEE